LTGIVLFFPVSLIAVLFIKLTSPGPIIFKQKRVGLNGKLFEIYKFRTMYNDVEDTIHKKYVSELIKGDCKDTTYKIVDDPRVTRVGRILRKLSLDEIPQFFNVVMGEMSLIGPRPPLQYEFENYQLWHQKRILAIKPGITGLWQVEGRSKTTFDDMVRMDLKYKKLCSLTLDSIILFKTIQVLFTMKGGY
jgi:lipopolysaccharide/colanic/teichoic acid biosynthesis glycosyltransferase